MIRYGSICLLVAVLPNLAATNDGAPTGMAKKMSATHGSAVSSDEALPAFWFAQAWREADDIRKPEDRCDALLVIGESQVAIRDKDGLRDTARRCRAAAESLDDARRIRILGTLVPLMFRAGGTQEAQTALVKLSTQASAMNGGEKQDETFASLGMVGIAVRSFEFTLSLVDKIDSPQHQADLCIALLDQIASSNTEPYAEMTIERVRAGLASTKWKQVAGRVGLSLTNALFRCGKIEPEERRTRSHRQHETFPTVDIAAKPGNGRTNVVNPNAIRFQRYTDALLATRTALSQSNDFATACETLEKCYRQLDKAQQQAAVKDMLQLYSDAGDTERAKQLLGRLDKDSDRADALIAIARALLGKGNKAQARLVINSATGEVRGMMRGTKNNAATGVASRYFGTLVGLWVQTGDWEQAMRLADLEAAAPSQKNFYRTISAQLASSGDRGAARDMLNRVREAPLRIATLCGIAEGIARKN